MPSERHLLVEIAELVCGSAVDETLLGAALERSAIMMRTSAVALVRQSIKNPAEGRLIAAYNIQPQFGKQYDEYFVARNPFFPKLERTAAMSAVFASHDLLTNAEFARTEFCNDLYRPQNLFYSLGGLAGFDGESVIMISASRPERGPRFSPRDRSAMQRIRARVSTALEFRNRLAAVSAALDLLTEGVFLLDSAGRICHANALGQMMLARGAPVAARRNVLVIGDAAVRRYRIPGFPGVNGATEAVFVTAPKSPARPPAGFGWTPAESRVSKLISEGFSIREIAGTLNLTEHTVRNQVKQAMHKAGVRRQLALAALFWKNG